MPSIPKTSSPTPAVPAWETRSERFTSLLQEASAAASAKLPTDIGTLHKGGPRIRPAQRVPGVNAWASEKALDDHFRPPPQRNFLGLVQQPAKSRFQNRRTPRWCLCVFVVNLLILAVGLTSVVYSQGSSDTVLNAVRSSDRTERAANGKLAPQITAAEHIDRKSTRLNSSHSQISYAVFCLKKKKNTQEMPLTATACGFLTPYKHYVHGTNS